MSGDEQVVTNDAGGRWVCDMVVILNDAEDIKLARALIMHTDGGAVPLLVPFYNDAEAPWPDGSAPSTVPHSDGSPFSDESEYLSGVASVTVDGAVALRATQVTLNPSVMADLMGGEVFSVEYPTKSHHIHAITRVYADNLVAVRPPWREATDDAIEVNFDRPLCLMRLDNADEALAAVTPPYRSALTLRFVEIPAP